MPEVVEQPIEVGVVDLVGGLDGRGRGEERGGGAHARGRGARARMRSVTSTRRAATEGRGACAVTSAVTQRGDDCRASLLAPVVS